MAEKDTSTNLCTGRTITYGLVLLLGLLASWGFLFITQPPPARVCGTPNGPPITAPRIKLPDGRRLAYKEIGVPKEQALHKIIVAHPFFGSRIGMLGASEVIFQFPLSPFVVRFSVSRSFLFQALLEELSVYMVSYDRAGYAESDPNPKRNLKSESEDLEALADALGLGPKFYVASISMGGYTAWSCLKYIPHRLAGVLMFAPVTNFWWRGLSQDEFREAMKTQAFGDKLTLYTAHYAPRLLLLSLAPSWLPKTSALDPPSYLKHANKMDVDLLQNTSIKHAEEAIQQSPYSSLVQDLIVMFSTWEFDPSDIANPFPSGNGSVHIWQGDEDYLVPVKLQRYVSRVLPWIRYHELPGYGHFIHVVADKALRCLIQNVNCD